MATKIKHQDKLQKVVTILATTRDEATAANKIATNLHVPTSDIPNLIRAARKRIINAASYDATEELGLSLERLDTIYGKAIADEDYKTALAAQKERNKLLALYRPSGPDIDLPAATPETEPVAEITRCRQILESLRLAPHGLPLGDLADNIVRAWIAGKEPTPLVDYTDPDLYAE